MSNILAVKQPDSEWEALIALLEEQTHYVYLAEGRDVAPLKLMSLGFALVITDQPDAWIEAQAHQCVCLPVIVCSNYYMVINNPHDGHIIRRMLMARWGASDVRVFPSEPNPSEVVDEIGEILKLS